MAKLPDKPCLLASTRLAHRLGSRKRVNLLHTARASGQAARQLSISAVSAFVFMRAAAGGSRASTAT
ncbi:hypothetical protein D3C87_660960 [compost metagenome]